MTEQPAILYVEDDAQSRKLMALLLRGRLHLPHVTIFEDSTNFQERVAALDPKPNVILLDIHLKPYNGFQMLSMLRQLEWASRVPIVALTASVMQEEVRQLQEAGFNGCFAKPINLDTFSEMLERVLAGEILWRIQ